jgi:sugar lactone lactonase YvrE
VEITVALDVRVDLGEGPIWDVARKRLLFVDIPLGEVYAFYPATGDHAVYEVGQPTGSVVPTQKGDWLIAVRDGFLRLDPRTGATSLAAIVEDDRPDNRMNDGYCDPRGRFWAGTMSMAHEPEAGALYRLDPDMRATRMLDHITTSNGIDWSPDERLMYYVDTGTRRIDVFDFDAAAGTVANRRTFADIAIKDGKPDGLVVDAEGGIWLALWGGSAIRRYTPDGKLERVIELPVTHPTKCAFGGPDLGDLFITSARSPVPENARAAQPHAGSVLHCRPGVTGRLPTPFAG